MSIEKPKLRRWICIKPINKKKLGKIDWLNMEMSLINVSENIEF